MPNTPTTIRSSRLLFKNRSLSSCSESFYCLQVLGFFISSSIQRCSVLLRTASLKMVILSAIPVILIQALKSRNQ
jgi:hypothetical protein